MIRRKRQRHWNTPQNVDDTATHRLGVSFPAHGVSNTPFRCKLPRSWCKPPHGGALSQIILRYTPCAYRLSSVHETLSSKDRGSTTMSDHISVLWNLYRKTFDSGATQINLHPKKYWIYYSKSTHGAITFCLRKSLGFFSSRFLEAHQLQDPVWSCSWNDW